MCCGRNGNEFHVRRACVVSGRMRPWSSHQSVPCSHAGLRRMDAAGRLAQDQGSVYLLFQRASAKPGPFNFASVQPVAAHAQSGIIAPRHVRVGASGRRVGVAPNLRYYQACRSRRSAAEPQLAPAMRPPPPRLASAAARCEKPDGGR